MPPLLRPTCTYPAGARPDLPPPHAPASDPPAGPSRRRPAGIFPRPSAHRGSRAATPGLRGAPAAGEAPLPVTLRATDSLAATLGAGRQPWPARPAGRERSAEPTGEPDSATSRAGALTLMAATRLAAMIQDRCANASDPRLEFHIVKGVSRRRIVDSSRSMAVADTVVRGVNLGMPRARKMA